MAKKSMINKQQKTQKFSSREYNRCKICGRPHAYLRKFGICRICFRELAYKGQIPGVMQDMCVEGPCMVDGEGIHPIMVDPLPPAITAMINQQGAIHQLVIEAFVEGSKNRLLQDMLLDPTISNYNNAVALIDEMCQREREILPELHW